MIEHPVPALQVVRCVPIGAASKPRPSCKVGDAIEEICATGYPEARYLAEVLLKPPEPAWGGRPLRAQGRGAFIR